MLCPKCHRRLEDGHKFCAHDGQRAVEVLDITRIACGATELAGTVIGGRYQIRGFLGKGAMAKVYLAQDRTTGEPVAVKILASKYMKEARTRARFSLEAKAMAKISHPHIVKVFNVGLNTDGTPYLVMEFLFGESMGDWLQRDELMPAELCILFAIQIASGLAASHRAGIIHRDIKPDNVFLMGERGFPYEIKLVDFGFAKLSEHSGVTQKGFTVGTVQYMAPEQAVSDPADACTDVYGLGALMYRMLTGRLPFNTRDEAEMLAHHLLSEPDPLELGGAPQELDLEAVVLKTLRKRPENRYPSMDALIEDLNLLVNAPPSGAQLAAHRPISLPDEYAPKSQFAATTLRFLCTKIGKTPPAP